MRNKNVDSIELINERRISRIDVIKSAYVHHFTPTDQTAQEVTLRKNDPSDFEKLLAIQYCAEIGFIRAEQNEEQHSVTLTLTITADGIDFYEDYVLETEPAVHGL